MSSALNKNFTRTCSPANIQLGNNESMPSTRVLSSISERISSIMQILTKLCQLLDDYPLVERTIEDIQQGTIDCILWNEDRSYPIAIDQNQHLVQFRQSLRHYLHESLDFTYDILMIVETNHEINTLIQTSKKYQTLLNDYRTKRQSAYQYFCLNYTYNDALFVLMNVDKEQFHQLRWITISLRQYVSKLLTLISPTLALLT